MKILILSLVFIIITIYSADNSIGKENNTLVESIIINTKNVDYINSSDYKKNIEIIKEELVIKLSEMIRSDKYDNLLEYMPFILNIADKRYVKLMQSIESRISEYAGVNIVGYSTLIELINKNGTSEDMINKVLAPKVGSYLFNDVSVLVMSKTKDINVRLHYFELMVEKTEYAYPYIMYSLLSELCNENKYATNKLLLKNSKLRNNIKYNCCNISEIP